MQFWNELEGRTIDGRHPLRRLVRSEGRRAWFETEAGDPQKSPATISLTEALTDADEVSDRLRAAQGIKHPNLVTILKVGQVDFDNTLFVYAVMEHIEQSLSDVLEGQALSAEEAREVAEALVGSLTAIHQKGMAHGHVEAASVLATEETVKLRSDCLQAGTAHQADDVAGIGATLFHAFTQRKGISATDAQINRIPAPFAEIVRNTHARRWTLAQVANALKPAAPALEPLPPVAPVAAPVAAKIPEKAPEKAPQKAAVKPPPAVIPTPVAPPVAVAKPQVPLAPEFEEDAPAAKPKTLPWVLAAAVLAVLAIIGWLILRPASTPQPQTATAPATAPVVVPATPPPAPVVHPSAKKPSAAVSASHTPKAPLAQTASADPSATPAAAAATPSARPVWRVIAYTYRFKQPADEMVAKITTQHPNLSAEVFSPHGKTSVYLVSLGGGMDRATAVKLLDKVRSMGLPADSFIQNYAE